jgi:hypothetical protein
MAKTLFDGGVTSKLWLDRRIFYPTPNEFAEMWPSLTPFYTVLSQLPIKQVPDPVYKMFEHESNAPTREFTVSSAITVAANGDESTAFTVGTITGLPATITAGWVGLVCEIWDATKKTKRGAVMITEASSTSTFKCKTLKATAITTVSGDYFTVMYRARGEGSVAHAGLSDELSVVTNSTAFLSDSCEVTGDLFIADKLRGYSNEMARLRTEMLQRFKVDTENMLLKSYSTLGTNMNGSDTFTEAGLRTLTDSDSVSGSVRTTYGYLPILEDYGVTYSGTGAISTDTNIFNVPGMAYGDFVQYCEYIFDKRPDSQIMGFCGRGFITKLTQNIANDDKKFGWKGKIQVGDTKINSLGFDMRTLETPHGNIELVPTRSVRNQYNNYCLLPDLNNIGIAQFAPDEYANDVKKDNDYDGVKDTIKARKGLWMQLLKRHHAIVL